MYIRNAFTSDMKVNEEGVKIGKLSSNCDCYKLKNSTTLFM